MLTVGFTTGPEENVYVLAPPGTMVNELPEQIEPLFTVIVGKGLTVTLRVCCGLVPQALDAVTVKIPLPPGVAEIVFVVLEPAQPPGRDHVYDVAPFTAETL